MDHSVKIWDLSSKSLLTTFQYPRPITVLAWDQTERLFFAASPDGSIHQTNLFRQREGNSGVRNLEAVGGAGGSDLVRVGEDVREAQKKRLISIGQQITSMTISLTSALLLVGTAAGLIHVVDIPTHQQLRTITMHKGSSITYLQTMLRPPDLIGHIDLSLHIGHGTDPKDNIPIRPILAFQRMRDAKAREIHDVSLMLPTADQPLTEPLDYSTDELLRDRSFFLQSAIDLGADAVTIKARVTELEGEVEHLKAQLGKAKSINDAMWDNVVQRIVMGGKASRPTAAEDEEDGERKRKRGRT
jgi:pre-rRNA-processing protein IPI3